MTSANRATRIGKLHTLLKKAYKPSLVCENRPLMEHLLYACLLENAPYELADEALARLEQDYFDWNEVRVTTITELAEVLGRLPDSTSAAIRLKKNLHGLFESSYTFDLEEVKKQNLGKAIQKFEKLPAMTPFVLAYITQHGLGGHAIPLDSAALRFFWLSDIINESELRTGRVTGLERAIPKSKGVEFASLLHQASVALNIDPNDETARRIVLTLNPELDQKVADHVAAVKQRRVEKAIAAAEAAETAEAVAESVAPKPKAAKTAKSGPKSTEKASTKNPAKTANSDSVKVDESGGKEADNSAGSITPKKSSRTKAATPKTAAGKSEGKSSADSTPTSPNTDQDVNPTGKKKGTKKPATSDSPKKKASKSSNDLATSKNEADADEPASSKGSSKKLSKRKPR
jgi:hypothetical protein